METVRDIKTLLEVVRDSLSKGVKIKYSNYGICGEIWDLKKFGIINNQEEDILRSKLEDNKPEVRGIHSEFTQYEFWIGKEWWWVDMEDEPMTRQIRINFINKLISEL